MKYVHQGRLANSGFTGNENDLPLTLHRSLQRIMKFAQSVVPANQLLCRPSASVSGSSEETFRDCRDELVSAFWERFDEFRFVMAVTQGFANSQNVFFYQLRIDISLRPY